MKKLQIAVIPSPGLLNHDLKGMQTPAQRLLDAFKSLCIILAPVLKVVIYFVTLVTVFAVMFGFFVMAATIQKPESTPTTIEKGVFYGTEHLPVPTRI